jgi:hypothetical protein
MDLFAPPTKARSFDLAVDSGSIRYLFGHEKSAKLHSNRHFLLLRVSVRLEGRNAAPDFLSEDLGWYND